MIIPEKFGKVDVLARTESATVDVGIVENPGAFRNYLEEKGFRVIEEHGSIWTIRKTEVWHDSEADYIHV